MVGVFRGIFLGALIWVLLGIAFYATRAECRYCSPVSCYSSSQCGSGCVCVTPPGRQFGQCWGVD